MENTCEACKFGEFDDKDSDYGECRRYPPQITRPVAYENMEGLREAIGKASVFPCVLYHECCGEWQSKA